MLRRLPEFCEGFTRGDTGDMQTFITCMMLRQRNSIQRPSFLEVSDVAKLLLARSWHIKESEDIVRAFDKNGL